MSTSRRPASWGAGETRGHFLAKGLGLSVAATGAGALLAACGDTTPGAATASDGKLTGAGGLPLARTDTTVTLPIYSDNKPIASGLKPEHGTLSLFNWASYINPKVTKAFGEKYGVNVTVTNFENMEEAIGKLSTGEVNFDVFFPGRLSGPARRGQAAPAAQLLLHPELAHEHLAVTGRSVL